MRVSEDGNVDYGAPGVRFGEFHVPSAVAWVYAPIGRDPAVRAEFEMRDGTPVCTAITVEATPGGRPVTTSDLATLPGLERKGTDAFKRFATRVFDDEDWRRGQNLHRVDAIHHPPASEVSSALSSRPNAELEQVAEVYRANIDRAPVEAVQEAFGLTRRTADRRIRAARDRGFLPETTRGKKRA